MSKQNARSTTKIDVLIGRRITAGRAMRGMSQDELARQVDVSFQQLQKYENATNRVAASRFWQIARALDLPLLFFFGDKDTSSLNLDELLSENSLELLKLIQPLAGKRRVVLFDMARQLARTA